MPVNAPISSFTAGGILPLRSLVPFVDVADTTDAATGTTKKALLSQMLAMAGYPFGGRLSLEAGVGISTSDQTAKSTLYLVPFNGNGVALYTSIGWVYRQYDALAVVLSGLTSARPYDVYCFTTTAVPSATNTTTEIVTFGSAQGWVTGSTVTVDATVGGLTADTFYYWNAASTTTGSFHTTMADALAGTNKVNLTANITQNVTGVSLELLAWASTVARQTILLTQDGVLVKGSSALRRYVGTIQTTSTTTTEDSLANRYVWNNYNQVERRLHVCPKYTDDNLNTSYTTATAAWTEANGSGNGRVNYIIGVAGTPSAISARAICTTSGTGEACIGIGCDGNANARVRGQNNTLSSTLGLSCSTGDANVIGLHTYYLLIRSGAGTATFFADTARATSETADDKATYLEGWLKA